MQTADALMMRSQQAMAFHAAGYLPPEHYDQIFSAHGTIMIFFVAMSFVIGLMNFAVPLQLGVRDVAFPTLNSVGFWLTAAGALLVNISLVVGEFVRTEWLPFPPLSERLRIHSCSPLGAITVAAFKTVAAPWHGRARSPPAWIGDAPKDTRKPLTP